MRIRGEAIGSHLSHIAQSRYPDQLVHMTGLDCDGVIQMNEAYVSLGSAKEQHRPCIVMSGEVWSVKAVDHNFPLDVTEITFGDEKRPKVSYRYQLSNDEISELVHKGMFGALDQNNRVKDIGFRCPSVFLESPFELPMTGEIIALPPADGRDVPVVFFGVENAYDLETNSYQSGYDNIADYFPTLEDRQSREIADITAPDIDFSTNYDDEYGASVGNYLGMEDDEPMHDRDHEQTVEQTHDETPEEYHERVTRQAAADKIRERTTEAMARQKRARQARMLHSAFTQNGEQKGDADKQADGPIDDIMPDITDTPGVETSMQTDPVQSINEPVIEPVPEHVEQTDESIKKADDIADIIDSDEHEPIAVTSAIHKAAMADAEESDDRSKKAVVLNQVENAMDDADPVKSARELPANAEALLEAAGDKPAGPQFGE